MPELKALRPSGYTPRFCAWATLATSHSEEAASTQRRRPAAACRITCRPTRLAYLDACRALVRSRQTAQAIERGVLVGVAIGWRVERHIRDGVEGSPAANHHLADT